MPNYCENDLRIEGKIEEIKKFLKYAKGKSSGFGDVTDLSFHKFIPYPKEYLDKDQHYQEECKRQGVQHFPVDENGKTLKDGFNQGGKDWRVKNWGVKWDAGDIVIEDVLDYNIEDVLDYNGDGEVEIHFDTAWAPPLPVVEAMGKMYPTLNFTLTYFEAGVGFNGMFCMQHGEVVCNEEGKYFGRRGG